MPKLNLATAIKIKTITGELLALKGDGFSWTRPQAGPSGARLLQEQIDELADPQYVLNEDSTFTLIE